MSVINLRRARKARARLEAEERAAENRARFGQTAAARDSQRLAAARLEAALDGARREDPDAG